MTRYPKQHGRHIGIFQIHNCVSRMKRPWTYINDSEDTFLIYSFVYNFEQFFLQHYRSFSYHAGASLLIVALCMVLIVRYFINVSTKTLLDSLQNDSDVLEKAVQLYIFVHPNKESHLLEEYRSRYSKFRTYQYEHKPCVVTRDRDPRRLPVKQLTRDMHKSRKIR